jgi:hypothetical protein
MDRKAILIVVLIFIFMLTGLGVCLKKNQQIFKFDSVLDPIPNPLMGWAPWATAKNSEQPHSLVYADLTWRELEPNEGEFDFTNFEVRNQFQRWSAEGKRVVFRFVLDKPGLEKHTDIPDWLFEKINGDGDFYENDYGMGFSPDYSNPILLEYHQKAVQALGEKYGRDNLIAYIEIGSLGHWGEWHINYEADVQRMPMQEVRNTYVMHYIEAFPDTHLMMRRPFFIADQFGLGLFNDLTGDSQSTNTWIGWIENGGEYDQTEELNEYAPMPNAWKIAPIGGEQAWLLADKEMYGQDLDQTIQLLRDSHTTFIGPGSPYKEEYGGDLQNGFDQVMSTIGYHFYVDQLIAQRFIVFSNQTTIRIDLGNSGIAPMYYDWPVHIYLLDEAGSKVLDLPISIDTRKILPDEIMSYEIPIPLKNIENGTYMIAIAILDPKTNQPAVKFAMDNPRSDLIQELGSFFIYRLRIN